MFSAEEARSQLTPFIDEAYSQKQVLRLAGLPPSLNKMGRALLGLEKRRAASPNQGLFDPKDPLDRLDSLPAYDRQRLFAALAPTIAEEMEAAWQVFDRLPFSSGFNRRPFRLKIPGQTASSHTARRVWLANLLRSIQGFNQPATWFAAWAAYLGDYSLYGLGILFAGAIDRGGAAGQEVFEILAASARGDHPTGRMGRHVVRALLCAARPDGWELVERLLAAAQREEGLRQVIMESADEGHPDAFARILHVILEQNMVRFSAVVRAAAVWAGLPFEAASPKAVLEVLTALQRYLSNPPARQAALEAGSPQDQYLALWSTAFEDALQAVGEAQPLLQHTDAAHRFTAVYLLSQIPLEESQRALLPMLSDADLRVAVCAFSALPFHGTAARWHRGSDLFERLEGLVQRLPEGTKTLKPIVWDWMVISFDRQTVANTLLLTLGSRPVTRLLPYRSMMASGTRVQLVKLLAERIKEDPQYRQILLEMTGDRDATVTATAVEQMEKLKPGPEEIQQLEGLLTRKSALVRLVIMRLLLKQPGPAVLASVDRLHAKRSDPQRAAALELLRELVLHQRESAACQARIAQFQREGLGETERHILADLLASRAESYSLTNALGLANLSKLSSPVQPRSKNVLFGLVKKTRLGTPAAVACLQALDELIHQHRTEAVEIDDWRNETRTELLGNISWGFRGPDPSLTREENLRRFPLAGVWEQWWQGRPAQQRDEDGMELLRAYAALSLMTGRRSENGLWISSVPPELRSFHDEAYHLTLNYIRLVASVLTWLVYLHPAPNAVPFLLEAVEEVLARFSASQVKADMGLYNKRWTIHRSRLGYVELARTCRTLWPQAWKGPHHSRFWSLMVWLEQFAWHKGGIYRHELEDLLAAHQAGAASEDDLYFFLVGYRDDPLGTSRDFRDLHAYSSKRPHALVSQYPFLQKTVESIRAQILLVEEKRGDLPTAASAPALSLRYVPGMEHLIRLLAALGKTEFDRSTYRAATDRANVFSHLIRVTDPVPDDTPEEFTYLVQAAGITEKRLVALAVYAPQWARFVETALDWQGMAEGVWWLYAHTKDRQWAVDADIRESWAAQISEYTPLSAEALMDGAVDVAWFHRIYALLGEERWQALYKVALYASGGTGHARARLFADAMLQRTSADELVERVKNKRNQDALRALGLVPLPQDHDRQAEILRRYEIMQEFIRTSNQFGSQRQASEKMAAVIGLENLARTAGFPDPQRLEWAMELESMADLSSGSITALADGVAVTLSVNYLGEAEIRIARGEKPLKSIPAAVKKDAQIAALVERKQVLEKQARRLRESLETAMVRGDAFTAGEIQRLFGHPILRPMLEQLIFAGPGGLGYPVDGGQALECFGELIPLDGSDSLRIAHADDLLRGGRWHDWQRECFLSERIQPFKQVFRELYVLTQTEQDEKNFSRRYAGLQVNPRQALALLGKRGWVFAPEEGVFKTFHAEGITARMGFLQAIYTPAEVEGLTIEVVGFTRRGDWSPLPLQEVPPRLFSETMRDVDLVVSVAHAGGVDPESSASTIEARTALAQEVRLMLQLNNVRLENRHILVDGKLGHYTIHLGSGVVHRQPGGALCIIPVHAQQRGRLFLPFADNDPKTAEILSKMLLLARDQDIKDPTILEQILR